MWELFCKTCLIIFILMCLHSFLGDVVFRLENSFPKVSEITREKIDTSKEPIQVEYSGAKKYIKAKGSKNIFALEPQADYSISGMVIAKNSNFWFRDIMRSKFDDVCWIDFGLVWGELAKDKKELYKNLKFKSNKTLAQARQLNVNAIRAYDELSWNVGYIDSHVSHTHIIPANSNIMGALLKIRKNENIKLNGYLVDIYTDKSELIAKTSLSRTDHNATSRGSGACEVMYVKSVQIGDKIYK